MANSFTGKIDTNGQFVDIEELTVGIPGSNFTGFTQNSIYDICIQNEAELKIADAIFPIHTDEPFKYTQGCDAVFIKTKFGPCLLTILEN